MKYVSDATVIVIMVFNMIIMCCINLTINVIDEYYYCNDIIFETSGSNTDYNVVCLSWRGLTTLLKLLCCDI